MKKVFLLSRGLDKFSAQELKNMQTILGGDVPYPIYIPTSGGGRLCREGEVWSDIHQKCVAVGVGVPVERK